ncbi:hypothetical protein QQG55_55475 [Brugia pahangi]
MSRYRDMVLGMGRYRGIVLGMGRYRGIVLRMVMTRRVNIESVIIEMDGFDSNEGVIIVAVTALLRPGRFDPHITICLPDIKRIFNTYIKKISIAPVKEDINFQI